MATEASAMGSMPAKQRTWLGGIRSKPAGDQTSALPQAHMDNVSTEEAAHVLERLARYTQS